MFHWICPECGREIPPKLKECPSCDPQSAPVAHVPDAVANDASETVVNQAPQTPADEPAPVENVAADNAVAPVAESPAPALNEIAVPVEPAVTPANTPVEPAEVQAAIGAAKTIELADSAEHGVTDEKTTEQLAAQEPAAVEPESTSASVEAAASPVSAGHADLGDERRVQSVADESPGSAPDTPTAVAASVPSTPAAARPELAVARQLDASHLQPSGAESAVPRQEPTAQHQESVATAPAEPPAELEATQQLAIPHHLVTQQPDAAVAGSQGSVPAILAGNSEPAAEAALTAPAEPLGPMPSLEPARDPLLALAEQIREAQTPPAFSFKDAPELRENAHSPETEPAQAPIEVVPEDVAKDDLAPVDVGRDEATRKHAAPEPTPIPAEPVPANVAVTSQPIPRADPEDAATEEIFLPPVLARLATSIGVSQPGPTTPAPVSPAPVSSGSGSPGSAAHDNEHRTEPVTQPSPTSASETGASRYRTTGPLELTSGRTESVGLMEAISPIESHLQVESAHTRVEPARAHVDSEHAHSGLALLTDAGPLALLAPPEAAPAPLETAAIQATPEPVASTAQLVPPQLPIAGLASPDDPSPGKPPSGSWLQLAPLQDYSAATAHSMQPVPLAAKILTPDSGPRMTLPGPTLPPELARFQNANLVTVIGDTTRTGKFRLPGWAVSFLVMLALLVIGVGVVFYFLPVAHSSAENQAPAVEGHGNASQPASPPPVPAQPAVHPLAQFVEVTGFRIVVDFNKKSEIHYLVVNHSGSDLSDVTVYVTLRTANAKPGQPPLCRFSFRAPSLGPFESKEMTSSIEKLSRSITLPEWQDLRPEVQIAQ